MYYDLTSKINTVLIRLSSCRARGEIQFHNQAPQQFVHNLPGPRVKTIVRQYKEDTQ